MSRQHTAQLRICCFLAFLLSCFVLSGCATSPPPEKLPTLPEIHSDAMQKRAQAAPPVAPPAQGIVTFQRIDLPLNMSLNEAWSVVDEDAFPAVTRGVWNANGLRVGLLSRTKVAAFIKALPPSMGVSHSQLLASAYPSSILHTPELTGYATIDLTIPPMAPHRVQVTGGRLQMLVRLMREPTGAMQLDLIPHHYVPKITLKPRSPLVQALDGRIFSELTLRATVPSSAVLVLGLYRPWKPDLNESSREGPDGNIDSPHSAPSNSDSESHTRDQGAAGTKSLQDHRVRIGGQSPDQPQPSHLSKQGGGNAAPPPPLTNNLGRALLVRLRGRHSVQRLLLISITPIHPTTHFGSAGN